MKKENIILIVIVLAVISSNVTSIWAFISFIKYIAKDTPFNWWSVYGFVLSIVVLILARGFPVYIGLQKAKRNEQKKINK